MKSFGGYRNNRYGGANTVDLRLIFGLTSATLPPRTIPLDRFRQMTHTHRILIRSAK
jgi:hypothetical protein